MRRFHVARQMGLVFVRFLAVLYGAAESTLIRMAKFMAFEGPLSSEQFVADVALKLVFRNGMRDFNMLS
uniref:Putative secreted peptide n=1 Tax=Anopheles braziliensis TaxID=58242 RepID=A0A2M3ZUL5_9DIPT